MLLAPHNNVHIPKESWPNWTWYALEFAIVLAVSMVISWKLSDALLPYVADAVGHGAVLESWVGISVHSDEFKALEGQITNKIVSLSNWIFYAIMGSVFLGWYVLIRGFILKKKVLS